MARSLFSPCRGALFVALIVGIRGADLDITGSPARVRFLDATDAEHAVLEGGEGWLNATVQVAAHDFVTSNGVSLDAVDGGRSGRTSNGLITPS